MATTDQTAEIVDKSEQFLREYYHDAIGELARAYPGRTSLVIDWMDVFQFDVDFADDLREYPDLVLESLEEALQNYDLPIDETLADARVRVRGLNDIDIFEISSLREGHTGRLLAISGQVSKVTDVEAAADEAAFECQRCGTTARVPQGGDDTLREPHECQGCERQGPFRINFDQSEMHDRQVLRVQEPPDEARGATGSTIDVVVDEGEIVATASPGDRVTITGVLRLQNDDDSVTFSELFEGLHITVEDSEWTDVDFEEHYDEICAIANGDEPLETLAQSIAPRMYGVDHLKRAIVLQLFGGVDASNPTGADKRGSIHIAMIGDPGTGKSSLLQAAHTLAPRSQMASGKGASAAGLTAAAVRDDFGETEWSIEGGALVMADRGVACVDEIDKVPEETVNSLHSALESQEVNIAKAGINATMAARTSLLAAGNPTYGRFDQYEPTAEQIDIDPALFSRFDLLFSLRDDPDPEEDRQLAEHATRADLEAVQHEHYDEDVDLIDPEVDEELFRAYVAYAKQEMFPVPTEPARDAITEWYTSLRAESASHDDLSVPVTPRYRDALVRLSEASARVRLSNEVTVDDVERAQDLMESSMQQFGLDPETGELDADVIETGLSSSQRQRIRTIKDVIEELADESEAGAPRQLVIDTASESGVDPQKAAHEIEKLKQAGEIYEPMDDHYRPT